MLKKTILAIAASGILSLGALAMMPASANATDYYGSSFSEHEYSDRYNRWRQNRRHANRHRSRRRHHCVRVWQRVRTSHGLHWRHVRRCHHY